MFSIFTACGYTKSLNNNDVRNDDVRNTNVVTESFYHDRVASMGCLQKVVLKIKYMHEILHEDVYVWSDGMTSQFRSHYVSKLLVSTLLPGKTLPWHYNERHHGRGPMNGIGGMAKNVISRKVKSGQLVVYSRFEFSGAMTKFVPSIHSL